MKDIIIRICNYAMPLLCLLNTIVATSVDSRIAWGIATLGWAVHLIEVRKNDYQTRHSS